MNTRETPNLGYNLRFEAVPNCCISYFVGVSWRARSLSLSQSTKVVTKGVDEVARRLQIRGQAIPPTKNKRCSYQVTMYVLVPASKYCSSVFVLHMYLIWRLAYSLLHPESFQLWNLVCHCAPHWEQRKPPKMLACDYLLATAQPLPCMFQTPIRKTRRILVLVDLILVGRD